MPIRRTLIFFALLIFVLPVGYFAYLANTPDAVPPTGGAAAASATNYQYHVVGEGTVVSVVSTVGEIEADETVDLSFTVPGEVRDIFVEPMTYVEEGDLLVVLENDNQRIAYDQAVLNLELAEINRDDLLGPVDGDEVRLAEARVEAALGSYRGASTTASQAEIQAAQLQVQQAEAAIAAAEERRMLGGNFSNQEEVNLADATIGEASFNAEIARQRLQDLRSGDYAGAYAAQLAYEQAQRELEAVLAGPTELEIAQAETRVEQAEAQLARAETALADTEIRALFTGYVTSVNVELGERVQPGQDILRMVDVDPLSVTVQIDEIDIGQIEPGMPARVELDAIPDMLLDAELVRVALTGTETQGGIVNYDAEIRLEDADARVRVGMTAEADLIVQQRQNVLRVPNAYVRLNPQTRVAFVNVVGEDNTVTEVQVTLGLPGEDYSEVISGLEVGDIIAADLSGTQLSLFGE